MSKWIQKVTVVCGVVAATVTAAHADRKQEIETYLRRFNANPAKVMNQRVVKKNSQGVAVKGESAFSAKDIKSRKFVEQRDSVRQGLCKEVGGAEICLKNVEAGRAPIDEDDHAENVVDNGTSMLRTLEAIESKHLTSAKLGESPWSDDYWAIHKGILGARYTDESFPSHPDWKTNKSYVDEKSFTNILNSRLASSIDDLSPSEKYDLLVGDSRGVLTAAMWAEGEEYYRASGKVEAWMGICHGWAPAAYMLPRPTSAVSVLAADGRTKLNFYPSDIKALGSLLWAKASTESRFIGGRCNDKDPAKDANGRVKSQDCFDSNPGTWHLAVVNQLGVSKRSMVLDATYDYEVWNQPLHAYSYTYFNPATGKAAGTLAEAKVERSAVSNDKFKAYRSGYAKYLVGVSMDVTYVIETRPSHHTTDGMERDGLRTARYMYDLELSSDGEVIGGEWYTNLHPDFLWTPVKGARAVSAGDRFVRTQWNGQGAIPAEWQQAAQRASRAGMPLAAIVEELIVLSRARN